MFEYRMADSIDEANRLAQDGYEIFYIVRAPAADGGQPRDHIYLRREGRRSSPPGFSASTPPGR
jgi:hypothetical protein